MAQDHSSIRPDIIDGPATPLDAAIQFRKADTLDMVRRAVDTRNVVLAFQPVVQTRLPKRAAFYEGLVRVLDEAGRIIPARDFIPLIEMRELGRMIDCLALEMGLIALRREPTLRLAINMSARSIGYGKWMDTLRFGLRGEGRIGERLILEISEGSAMLMPDIVAAFMEEVASTGLCFSLDDFGSGYMSLRHLREFNFDMVKIDGEFIRGIDRTPDNQVVTKALVSVARQFEMFTIAESVETADEARYLAGMGLDCMQGYFFGAPSTKPPWRTTGARRSSGTQ